MQLNPCLRLQSTRSPQHLGIQLAQERSLTQSDKCVDSAVARAGRCCPVWSRSPTCIRFPGAWCGTCTQPSALTAESRVVTCCVLIMHIWGFGGSNYPGRSANVWGRCMYLALYQFTHRRAEMQHRLRICCCPAILQNCTRRYLPSCRTCCTGTPWRTLCVQLRCYNHSSIFHKGRNYGVCTAG